MSHIEREQQMEVLTKALSACVDAVGAGEGAILITATGSRVKVEAFNCDEEELHSILAIAHEMVCGDTPAEGEVIQ